MLLLISILGVRGTSLHWILQLTFLICNSIHVHLALKLWEAYTSLAPPSSRLTRLPYWNVWIKDQLGQECTNDSEQGEMLCSSSSCGTETQHFANNSSVHHSKTVKATCRKQEKCRQLNLLRYLNHFESMLVHLSALCQAALASLCWNHFGPGAARCTQSPWVSPCNTWKQGMQLVSARRKDQHFN